MGRSPEAVVKDEVKKILKKHGVWYFMYVPHGYTSGVPDFICCHKGQFLAIECKAKDGMGPTALQAVQMQHIEDAGGEVFVITPSNLGDLERWCEDVTKI